MPTTIKEALASKQARAKELSDSIYGAKRSPTAREATEIKSLTGEIEALLKQQSEANAGSAARAKQFGRSDSYTDDQVFADNSPKARGVVAAKVTETLRSKAVDTSLFEPIPVEFLDSPVMLPGQTAWKLSQLLPRKVIDGAVYQYLRQTSRNHAAAVWDPNSGLPKPTSTYGFETQKGELKVLAHLSDPLQTYWVQDFPEAVTAISSELLLGLAEAEEHLVLNGTEAEDGAVGLFATSGIQTVGFDTDLLTTTRTAVTRLEEIGYAAGGFVLNPRDWQALELARNSSGQLEFAAGPVDRAEKRLWGVPVATSTHVEQGLGLALDLSCAHVLTDGVVRISSTNSSGEDFEHNRIRLRAEHRFDVAVTSPTGVVKIDLTA